MHLHRLLHRVTRGVSLLAMALASGVGHAEPISSFGLFILPDTQFYSRYAIAGENQFQSRYGSEPYATQTSWVARHAGALGVPFVLHLGDVVDRLGTDGEWVVADAAIITRGALTPDQWLTARKNRVLGSGGHQNIVGSAGDDQIFGNEAADTLTGGAGRDTFVYHSLRDGITTITDFTPGEDKLNLAGLLSSIGHVGNDPFADGTLRVLPGDAGALVQVRVGGSYRSLVLLEGVTAVQAAAPPNFLF